MINKLAKKFKENSKLIEGWFETKAEGIRLPITSSVDIRNAGFKITVVDTNVFPAGFNNLCNNFSKIAAQNFKKYFETNAPKAKKVLIVPETFTRNLNYLENVRAMQKLLQLAKLEAAVGFLGETLPQNPHEVSLPSGEKLVLEQLERKNGALQVKSFKPDAILLNNDCSDGIPEILQNVSQPIFPSPDLGWHTRRKKHHFIIYCQLVEELGKALDIDCWHFCPITYSESNVDIENQQDLERLAKRAEQVLGRAKTKYTKYGINEKPYVFVKSNVGTFGLGLTHVESPDEILNLNRKGRQKLTSAKGGGKPTEFLIQEGIPTIDSLEGAPIEPVLY